MLLRLSLTQRRITERVSDMVIKRLSCVLRLTDGCMNRPLTGSEAALYSDGIRLRHEYKPGGYFVVTDLPAGECTVTVIAYGYQTENIRISVSGEDDIPALSQVRYIPLNPSEKHPAAARMPSVSGTAPGMSTLYVVRPVGNMRVAEESSAAGADEIKMFSEGKTPPFPCDFVIGSGLHAELVTFISNQGGVCRTEKPMKYAHKRSENAVPLIRLQCTDNRFFLLIPGIFSADSETGKIPLKFAAVKSGKIVYASAGVLPGRHSDISELKMKGEK